MNVRVRGIYSTALTALFADGDDAAVVQPSAPIAERFDPAFELAPADVAIDTTADRQGVGLVGDPEAVDNAAEQLRDVARDAFAWADPTPRGAVFDGAVTEELGGGAVVDLGDGEGFLPYGAVDGYVESGDRLRVQVREPAPPWGDDRPELGTDVELGGSLARLVRGGAARSGPGPAELVDLLPTDPCEGWAVRWEPAADDADFDALDDALSALNERAVALDDALAAAGEPGDGAPTRVWTGPATTWCWFGRESRFALDEYRREVVPTMTGHHRIKAGANAASAAVDFAEAVCGGAAADAEFPFDVVARQFGPRVGDRLAIHHGKPDGRLFSLGTGEVTDREADGSVTVRRELSPGGRLDAIGEPIEAGDVAVTTFREGRWWYPTVYRDADGDRKGTYVNVCTPVEVFPEAARYVDLHVDVVKLADGTVERVDDDELDAAVADGDVTEALAEKARGVAAGIEQAL
ncbi:MAG: DUF402 domain-containing protein [Haloarculaceae archaeon]